MTPGTDAADALRAAAAVGAFFDVVGLPPGRGWCTLRDLVRTPAVLDRRVARTRRGVARPPAVVADAVPLRTAASIDLLDLAARVLSPALGAAALTSLTPQFRLDRLWLRSESAQLAVTAPEASPTATARAAAQALYAGVVSTVLVPLVDAYADRYRLSTKVLWGNVASALHGSTGVLLASGLEVELDPAEITAALLGTKLLDRTVRSTQPRFIRNSCCLYYRIPGAGVCGDCLLTA